MKSHADSTASNSDSMELTPDPAPFSGGLVVDARPLRIENGDPVTKNCDPMGENRDPVDENWDPVAENRDRVTEKSDPVNENRDPVRPDRSFF